MFPVNLGYTFSFTVRALGWFILPMASMLPSRNFVVIEMPVTESHDQKPERNDNIHSNTYLPVTRLLQACHSLNTMQEYRDARDSRGHLPFLEAK